MTKKCVFLTGATGYLGSNLVPEFAKNGCKLKLLVRAKKISPYERVAQSLSRIDGKQLTVNEIMQKVEIFEGDITTKNLGLSETVIHNLSKEVTDVFHCASTMSFDENKRDTIRRNNIEGVKNMLSFAEKIFNVHFHYISTAYICGQRSDVVREEETYVGQQFNNSYESSKCEAEILIRNWADKCNAKITIYRPSIIIGDAKTGKNFSSYGLYGMLKIADRAIRKFKSIYSKGNPKIKGIGVQNCDGSFYIPLRVIGRRDKTLNVVTIDYMLQVIISIFKNRYNVGKTFHITNSHPPMMGLLKDCLFETLKVSGVKFVLPEVFDIDPIKSWDRLFNKNIHVYTPYLLQKEAFFDDKNTQKILKNSDIKHVEVNKQLIMKLLAYSQELSNGKNNK